MVLFSVGMCAFLTLLYFQIRWVHELRSFKGIKVHTWDNEESLGNGDIVVCEMRELHRAIQHHADDDFKTILVDGRCPNGFEGSRASTCLPQTIVVPPETLRRPEWWNILVRHAADDTRRLIIEDPSSDDLPQYMNGLPTKMCLELSAWRCAFLLHGPVSITQQISPARAMLSWGRRRVLDAGKESGPLSGAVQKVLMGTVASSSFVLDAPLRMSKSIFDRADVLQWDARLCAMPAKQRVAYLDCCSEMQTLLTSNLRVSRVELDNLSEALICLRRLCAHADLRDLVSGAVSWFDGGSYITGTGARTNGVTLSSSASQLSEEVAHRVLAGSGKFQALLSVLIEDCNFEHLARFRPNIDESYVQDRTERNGSSKQEMNRIAIVASLPELQLMTSMLLNCVGVDHDLLSRTPSHSPSFEFTRLGGPTGVAFCFQW